MRVRVGLALVAILIALPVEAGAQARPKSCPQYEKLAREVGWPKKEIKHLSYIMARESSCFPRAWNRSDPFDGSHGLAQINGSNKGFLMRQGIVKRSMIELWKPKKNLQAALALWKECGWACWGTKRSRP